MLQIMKRLLSTYRKSLAVRLRVIFSTSAQGGFQAMTHEAVS